MPMTPEEMEHLIGLLLEKIDRVYDRQDATARAVRELATGLTSAEARHKREFVDLQKIEAAVLALVPKSPDLTVVTAHDLANSLKPEVINKARAIQWARKRGEPEPAPDTADELVPVHMHRRRDDSITFKTGKHGEAIVKANVRVRVLIAWGVAAILAGLHAWRLVADALRSAGH